MIISRLKERLWALVSDSKPKKYSLYQLSKASFLLFFILFGILCPDYALTAPGSTVSLTPSQIRVSTYEGHLPLTKWSFALSNHTGEILDLSLTSTAPWLSCASAKVSVTDSHRINLVFSTSALAIGTYEGSVQILTNEDFPIAELLVILVVNPTPQTSEFATLAGIDRLHNHGIFGQGTSVAIIDVGFKHLVTVLSSARHPYQIATYDFTGTGLQADSYHGMATTEVVHGLAPEATLYLLKVIDKESLAEAVDFCIDNQIDIIVHPVGWFNFGYDGQGEIAAIAEKARTHDILWVNSTGNHAKHHYRSTFLDINQNGFHEFYANGETIEEENHFSLTAGEAISIYLSWDGNQFREQDYDLFLMHKDTVLASSAAPQQDTFWATEAITSFFAPISGEYGVKIKKHHGDHDQPISLFIDYPKGGLSYYSPDASLLSPADAAGVLAVGAIGLSDWEMDGPPAAYSSRGPTLDGRIKPDIMGPGIIPVTFGNFIGTSPACAYIGGVAALLKTLQSNWKAAELAAVLNGTSIDLGEAGKDALYGYGKVDLSALTIRGQELFFPHVAMKNEWSSKIAITNLTDQAANLNIFTYDDIGGLLSFQATTLPPHSILSGNVWDISRVELKTGSLIVRSDQPLAGMVCFRNKDDIAAASAIRDLHDRLFFSCHSISDDRNWTGVAILNPHDQATDITLSLFGKDGEQKGQQFFVLAPNEKLLGVLANLFPSPLPTATVFSVKSTLPVAGLVVEGERGNSIASFSGSPLSTFPLLLLTPDTDQTVPPIVMTRTNFVSFFLKEGADTVSVALKEDQPVPAMEGALPWSVWQQLDYLDKKVSFLPGLEANRNIIIPYLINNNDLNTICVICNPEETSVDTQYRFYSMDGGLFSNDVTRRIPGNECYFLSSVDLISDGILFPFEGSLFFDAAEPIYGASIMSVTTKSGGTASLPAKPFQKD